MSSNEGNGSARRLASYIGVIAPVLAIVSLALYSYLSLAYYKFYHTLGILPSDVGLNYSSMLAGSAGFVLDSLADFGITFIRYLVDFAIAAVVLYLVFKRKLPPAADLRRNFPVAIRSTLLLLLLAASFSTFNRFSQELQAWALQDARRVRCGHGLNGMHDTYHPNWGTGVIHLHKPMFSAEFTILSVKAVPARLLYTGEKGKAPRLEELAQRDLFYLGQTNSTAVFYDVENHRPVYLPSSSVLVVQNSDSSFATTTPKPQPDCS
jgi:hypothetical protein